MAAAPHPAPDALAETFPPLTKVAALREAHRCLYCYDAPCTHACPTHIDIPAFIKKIATGNLLGSARTILDANLLGATCARVCPVQELCEGACVLNDTQQPIAIGRLQRHAMDHASAHTGSSPLIQTAPPTGRRIAVVGAGPAGLSCAGELARRGHAVTLFEKRDLPGGLSTYGIIALREPIEIALAEARMIEQLGVTLRTGIALGTHITLADLQRDFEMIVLSTGLGKTPHLGIPGEDHILDGLDYVEASKTGPEPLHVGRRVLVIGAGNTAIDCATIAKRLGAENVTIVYRRTAHEMTAYAHEYAFARAEGIDFRFLAQPLEVLTDAGTITALRCAAMQLGKPDATGRATPSPIPGADFLLPADQIIRAIGQQKPALAAALHLRTTSGFLAVDETYETSTPGLFAIGDCIRSHGAASTVMAVEDGKLAAIALHRRLIAAASPQLSVPTAQFEEVI